MPPFGFGAVIVRLKPRDGAVCGEGRESGVDVLVLLTMCVKAVSVGDCVDSLPCRLEVLWERGI